MDLLNSLFGKEEVNRLKNQLFKTYDGIPLQEFLLSEFDHVTHFVCHL